MTESVKKYICIHGPNHGGTTLLGAMLASSHNWADHPHVGEAHAFFTDNHTMFGRNNCGGGDDNCNKWNILNPKAPNPFNHMFRNFETNTIIDSSKTEEWYARVPAAYDIRHILIWRCPRQLKNSYRKRLDITESELRYAEDMARLSYFCKNYQKKFIAVSLEYLTANPDHALERICDYTDVEPFTGKYKFWNFDHHHFGGAKMVTRMLSGRDPGGIQLQAPVDSHDNIYEKLGEWIKGRAKISLS